jgi:predicted dehydrogenase
MTTIAVVGVGGWGKNLARNYHQIPECRLKYLCDLDQKKLDQLSPQLPGSTPTRDLERVLEDEEVEALVIATPAPTHHRLCRLALEHGKDVYVEKPFVLATAHARELIDLARARGRVLMVGHLLEYHPVVNRLRELIHSGELGEIYYIYSQRVNLGTVRVDENALWNFAPHDVSSILYLLGREPTDVSARGQSYLRRGVEDVVFMTMNFNDTSMAHVHVSWLDPHKIRKLIVVGSRKMAVFDDSEGTEKLRIYDKGAAHKTDYDSFAEYVGLRFGDIVIPYVKVGEPLRLECLHFLECVRNRSAPRSDGEDGLRVIRVLEAAQRSLEANGIPVELGAADRERGLEGGDEGSAQFARRRDDRDHAPNSVRHSARGEVANARLRSRG